MHHEATVTDGQLFNRKISRIRVEPAFTDTFYVGYLLFDEEEVEDDRKEI